MSTGPSSHHFRDPLLPQDSEVQTVGCRHTNPSVCSKHSLQRVCAFVRDDGLCLAPPTTWPKQYRKLRMFQESAKS
jgi:hypothetical protein